MLYIHINWNNLGGFYFIKLEDQKKVLKCLTKQKYKLPKLGTNPRGVEITTQAINCLIKEKGTKKIEINWNRIDSINKYSAYDRWLTLWNTENINI